MRDDEWRLIHPTADITFGTAATPIFNRLQPDLGDVEIRNADAPRPRGDGLNFGIDYRSGRTITFDLGIRGVNEVEARRLLSELTTAWRADAVRETPGGVAELRARYRGREVVMFGRPRRFVADTSHAKGGFIGVLADFSCSDDLFYSVEEAEVGMTITPTLGGGLMAPLAAPLGTTTTSSRSLRFDVQSDLPVWPVYEVKGPITNPVVEVVGISRFEFRTTLAYDQSLVVDTRPWGRTVLRNGASVAGTLTPRSTRLSQGSVPAGNHNFAFRGTDSTGTASVTARWRETFPTL